MIPIITLPVSAGLIPMKHVPVPDMSWTYVEARMQMARMKTINDYYDPAAIEKWDVELEILHRRIHKRIDDWLAKENRMEVNRIKDEFDAKMRAFRLALAMTRPFSFPRLQKPS